MGVGVGWDQLKGLILHLSFVCVHVYISCFYVLVLCDNVLCIICKSVNSYS